MYFYHFLTRWVVERRQSQGGRRWQASREISQRQRVEERNKRENVKKEERERVYKSVIWSTEHVRGPRSLRRRNKSSTYVPYLFLCYLLTPPRTPTPNPPRSSYRPAAVIYSRITVAYNKPLFILRLGGVAGRGGTDFPRDLMESPTWKYNSVKAYTRSERHSQNQLPKASISTLPLTKLPQLCL